MPPVMGTLAAVMHVLEALHPAAGDLLRLTSSVQSEAPSHDWLSSSSQSSRDPHQVIHANRWRQASRYERPCNTSNPHRVDVADVVTAKKFL